MADVKAASLAERLAARPRPSVTVPLQVDDPIEAQRKLADAESRQRQVTIKSKSKGQTAAKRKAQAEVDAAQAEVDACYAHITLTAMKPEDYEALIAAHPPTEEQKTEGDIWDINAFRPALLAECCPEMTADQWAEFLASNCSKGERSELWLAALGINENMRSPEPSVGKGSTATLENLAAALVSRSR